MHWSCVGARRLVSPAAAGCLNPLLLSDIALAPNWYQKVLISQTKAWNSVGAVARHKSNKVYSLCTENQQRSVSAPPPGPVYATDAHAQPPQAIPERRLHNHISRAHARAPVLYHTHVECTASRPYKYSRPCALHDAATSTMANTRIRNHRNVLVVFLLVMVRVCPLCGQQRYVIESEQSHS